MKTGSIGGFRLLISEYLNRVSIQHKRTTFKLVWYSEFRLLISDYFQGGKCSVQQ